MRDQAELARECLAAEERGEDVIAYLKGRGFISPRATWERLQINYLGRGKRNWKGEIQLAEKMKKNQKVTAEQKAQAVEIAIQGGDPLAYLQACGSGNATSLWYMIRQALQKTDLEKYEELKAHYKPASGRKKAEAAEPEEAPAEEAKEEPKETEEQKKPTITAPLMYDGGIVRAIELEYGTYHFQEINGEKWIDYDDKELANQLSMTVEQWRGFLTEIRKAAAILGVEL